MTPHNGIKARRPRSLLLFWLTTSTHVMLAALFLLGGSILVGALCKLVWRAFQFGWGLWI